MQWSGVLQCYDTIKGGLAKKFGNYCFKAYDDVAFVYLDNILRFSFSDLQIQKQQIHLVLQQLLHHLLCVKVGKCEFHAPLLFFQGYLEGEVRTDPEKVCAVKEWPIQSNRKLSKPQEALGFAKFYKQLHNFGSPHLSKN